MAPIQRPRTGDGAISTVGMIDNYLIDVMTSEEHVYEADITDYPVEDGADVTDNIRPKGVQVTVHCIISNTPFGPISDVRTSTPPADECYEHLRQLIKNRALVTIRTSLKTFNNMALKSLTIPRRSGGGDFLEFTATFIHVVVVKNARTVRVSAPIAVPSHGIGKSPAAVPDNDPRYTVLNYRNNDEGGYLWFDPDIDGWRRGAYPPSVTVTEFDPALNLAGGAVGLRPTSWNGVASGFPNSVKWALYKGRPAGLLVSQWSPPNYQTDAAVKAHLKKFLPNGNLPDGAPSSQIQLVSASVKSTRPAR